MESQSDSNQISALPGVTDQQGSSVTGQPVPPWVSASAQTTPSAPPSQPSQPPVTPKESPSPPAAVKKSPFAKLIPLLLLLVLIGGIFLLITRVVLPSINQNKEDESTDLKESITLTYWGLWESKEIIQPLIDKYQELNPQIKIDYVQQSYRDYRERLQSALAKGEGPDIFRYHITWIPMLKNELSPAPKTVSSQIKLEENFYPVAKEQLQIGDQIFGVPLGFDDLVLYYNAKILKEAGKTFPNTWDELQRTAKELCVADTKDKECKPGVKIKVAGVALGTADNVDHFSDILGLMMLQNGVDLKNPTGNLAEDALKFYTLFYSRDRVWDETFPNSVYAFAQEKVAIIFAPSWRSHEIKQINPDLEFATAAMPQLPGTQIAWASFWVEGVSNQNQHSAAAWDFLQYLIDKETLQTFYAQASKIRVFGEPYPLKELASQLEDDPIVGAVVKQGEYAQTWYMCSATHDNGINDRIIKYFEDAVNSVNSGTSVSKALGTASQGVSQVLTQYGTK